MSTIIIWILAAVGIAQAVLATRAYRLEKREGLARSGRRFAATTAIAVALVGLGVVATLRGRGGSTETPVAEAPKHHSADEQKQVDALKKEVAELADKLGAKQAELDKLDPQPKVVVATEVPEPSPWPLLVAVALVVLGFAMLSLGDLETLLPKRRKKGDEPAAASPDPADPDKPRDEPATLPVLTGHATAGRWKAALAVAHRIQIEQLHKLERLDYLYLRAYCGASSIAAPEDGKPIGSVERDKALALATSDLDRLLELAPNMAEARWLAGYVKALAGTWQVALDTMRTARPELGTVREFDRDESVCLLALAEDRLAAADNDGATRLFDEVTKLGVLHNQIPVAMVTHRILTVRGHIKAGKFTEAADGIARIRQVEGLDDAAARASAAACDVYDVAIQYRSGQLERALEANQAFFKRWQPADLPPVEDQVADEYLLPAIDKDALPLPADLYRGLYFLEAVVRVDLASRAGKPLTGDVVDQIATALLRALQFQPRHRESLAALAALYLAYRKDRSEKAIAWLDAALVMGVRSAKAHQLLVEARRAEVERKELLAMFRSAAARFLSDPAVGVQVRAALIEELGRFDEFRPVVLDLQDSGALDAPPIAEVTLAGMRERAAFVGGVAGEIIRRGDHAAAENLSVLQRELVSLTSNVETSSTRIALLERQVMEQLGRIVLR